MGVLVVMDMLVDNGVAGVVGENRGNDAVVTAMFSFAGSVISKTEAARRSTSQYHDAEKERIFVAVSILAFASNADGREKHCCRRAGKDLKIQRMKS